MQEEEDSNVKTGCVEGWVYGRCGPWVWRGVAMGVEGCSHGCGGV